MSICKEGRMTKIVFLSVALFIAAPSGAMASVIYDLTAICDVGCTGSATGVLTLEDTYLPGSAVARDDIVSLTYASSSGTLEILGPLPSFGITFSATMPFDSGTADFLIASSLASFLFQTEIGGDWAVQSFDLPGSDGGAAHTWTRRTSVVSEPRSGLLLILSLLIIGAARRATRTQCSE